MFEIYTLFQKFKLCAYIGNVYVIARLLHYVFQQMLPLYVSVCKCSSNTKQLLPYRECRMSCVVLNDITHYYKFDCESDRTFFLRCISG